MVRKKQPHILILSGVNLVGQYLVQTLLEEGGFLYVLGYFDTRAREFVKKFKDSSFKYFDISVASVVDQRIEYLDYVIILLYEPIFGTETAVNINRYIDELELINKTLNLAKSKSAKVVVVTSMLWEKRLSSESEISEGYTHDHIQAFAERALVEYCKKQGLNGRVVRLGEVYGRGMDLNSRSFMVDMIKQALTEEEIVVPGDGLQFLYYIHVLDAVYGILKAIFSDRTNGEIFTLANPQEISLLSLAHKILEQTVVATKVRFEKESVPVEPLFDEAFVPAKNLTTIGWNPKISFERGVAQTVDYFKELMGIRSKKKKSKREEGESGFMKEGVTIGVKMEDVLPVEISREQERLKMVKKKVENERVRWRMSRLLSFLTWGLRIFLALLFLCFYIFIFVPTIGVIRSVYFIKNDLRSYLEHLKANNVAELSADREYIDNEIKRADIYLNQLEWIFTISRAQKAKDKILANIYGVESFIEGCDYILRLENGQGVLIKGEPPKINNLNDSLSVSQAKLKFADASIWLQNGVRTPNIESFWQPFEEVEEISLQITKKL